MSFSKKYNQLVTVARALGRDTITFKHGEIPALKGMTPKGILIQCRGCEGMGTHPENPGANCPQCGGKGVEKLSMKAYNKELRKQQQQIAVKTKPAEEQEKT